MVPRVQVVTGEKTGGGRCDEGQVERAFCWNGNGTLPPAPDALGLPRKPSLAGRCTYPHWRRFRLHSRRASLYWLRHH